MLYTMGMHHSFKYKDMPNSSIQIEEKIETKI